MWETTFPRISNALNDHPIAKGNQTNLSLDTFDIITPNRLILGTKPLCQESLSVYVSLHNRIYCPGIWLVFSGKITDKD